MRRLDFPTLRIEALNVTIAKIIGEDVNDVGFAFSRGKRGERKDEE